MHSVQYTQRRQDRSSASSNFSNKNPLGSGDEVFMIAGEKTPERADGSNGCFLCDGDTDTPLKLWTVPGYLAKE